MKDSLPLKRKQAAFSSTRQEVVNIDELEQIKDSKIVNILKALGEGQNIQDNTKDNFLTIKNVDLNKKLDKKKEISKNEEINDFFQDVKSLNGNIGNIRRDGKGIFVNKMKIPGHCVELKNSLYFTQLFKSNLGGITAQDEPLLCLIMGTYYASQEVMIKGIFELGVPIWFIKGAEVEEASSSRVFTDKSYPNVTYINAKPSQYSKFHPKFLILEFTSFLRIVILSGNFKKTEWEIFSQVIWFQDFPRRTESQTIKEIERQSFYKQLREFLESSTDFLFPKIKLKIRDFNYSSAAVSLVYSISGRFRGEERDKFGIGCLRRGMSEGMSKIHRSKWLGHQGKGLPYITYSTSSIGHLTRSFLETFYRYALGESKRVCSRRSQEKILDNIEIIYPTQTYVMSNPLGPEKAWGYFIPPNMKLENIEKFPLCTFRCSEVRDSLPHLLMHTKVMVIADEHIVSDGAGIYVGSANLSAAAWGRLADNGKSIYISNYELGVLFPPRVGTARIKQEILDTLCLRYPPTPYAASDRPWDYTTYRNSNCNLENFFDQNIRMVDINEFELANREEPFRITIKYYPEQDILGLKALSNTDKTSYTGYFQPQPNFGMVIPLLNTLYHTELKEANQLQFLEIKWPELPSLLLKKDSEVGSMGELLEKLESVEATRKKEEIGGRRNMQPRMLWLKQLQQVEQLKIQQLLYLSYQE